MFLAKNNKHTTIHALLNTLETGNTIATEEFNYFVYLFNKINYFVHHARKCSVNQFNRFINKSNSDNGYNTITADSLRKRLFRFFGTTKIMDIYLSYYDIFIQYLQQYKNQYKKISAHKHVQERKKILAVAKNVQKDKAECPKKNTHIYRYIKEHKENKQTLRKKHIKHRIFSFCKTHKTKQLPYSLALAIYHQCIIWLDTNKKHYWFYDGSIAYADDFYKLHAIIMPMIAQHTQTIHTQRYHEEYKAHKEACTAYTADIQLDFSAYKKNKRNR